MARENPPMDPAANAQNMLVREGNAACCVRPTASISTNAQTCEKPVSTKALARREPYPPAKSEAPQRKTAVTEQAAGLDKLKPEVIQKDTPEEGNTGREGKLKSLIRNYAGSEVTDRICQCRPGGSL